MNHLTLYGYEEDGELFVNRCPWCGSAGRGGSICEGHEPPLEMHGDYGPIRRRVRVPGVGEEPRYTLEQVRAGLLSDGAQAVVVDFLGAWSFCPVSQASDKSRACLEDAAKQLLEAALDHFTQQPAGVGADEGTREGRSETPDHPHLISADSDGNQQLREEAFAALKEFNDHGDYEAPIAVLGQLLKGGGAAMKELGPDEGINRLQHPDCRAYKERPTVNVGLLAENTQLKKKLAELQQGGRQEDVLEVVEEVGTALESGTEQVDKPGDSVQCGGVALEELLGRVERERLREAMTGAQARGALYDAHMRYQDVDRKTEEGWATFALEAVWEVALAALDTPAPSEPREER